MKVQHLIHSIVQQTTILIAQLATSGGVRAPLAHIANQVFVDLAKELDNQGLSRKVSADMFGISLRSYQRRVARLKESSTVQGHTLWEAIFEEVKRSGPISKQKLLDRFCRDDEELVRGVLRDLGESALVQVEEGAADEVLRVTDEEEQRSVLERAPNDGLEEFVWAVIYRSGPLTLPELGAIVHVSEDVLCGITRSLLLEKRVISTNLEGEPRYASHRLEVERDASVGWEASVYDHFQAMVATISSRLDAGSKDSEHLSKTGGSTYSFDVYPGHPLREEVLGLLQEFRERASELRTRVVQHNRGHPSQRERERVIVYAGERVVKEELRPEAKEATGVVGA